MGICSLGKKSFGGRSLHHIGQNLNPYEQAISIIGKTLAAFDEDNLIPCFGFGDGNSMSLLFLIHRTSVSGLLSTRLIFCSMWINIWQHQLMIKMYSVSFPMKDFVMVLRKFCLVTEKLFPS